MSFENMKSQNTQSDLVVDLSAQEQEELSGGWHGHRGRYGYGGWYGYGGRYVRGGWYGHGHRYPRRRYYY